MVTRKQQLTFKQQLTLLKKHRGRVAGENGFRWIKSSPAGRRGRCCMVAWCPPVDQMDEYLHMLMLPEEVTRLIDYEVQDRHGGDWTAAAWNDYKRGATKKETLDILDTVISRLEM
jgi:hypothetical protein